MRKCFCVMALAALTLATPLFAQLPTVGVYWNMQGTQMVGTLNGDDMVHAYVIAFWENRLAGAAWSLELDPRLTLVSLTFADGLHIGDPMDGCGVDQALFDPAFGFFGTPIFLADLQLYTGMELLVDGLICVRPNCNYPSVMVADASGILYEACCSCAFFNIPVEAEQHTWGSVKDLYR
jgi:hypothetical protein